MLVKKHNKTLTYHTGSANNTNLKLFHVLVYILSSYVSFLSAAAKAPLSLNYFLL
jgi:hypothetical protein